MPETEQVKALSTRSPRADATSLSELDKRLSGQDEEQVRRAREQHEQALRDQDAAESLQREHERRLGELSRA